MRDDTKHVTGTGADPAGFESVSLPVHRASTIVFPGLDEFERRGEQFYDGYAYGLYGTPTTRSLEATLADLEQGMRALVVPSGTAAIALATFTVMRPGKRLLMPDSMYGPAKAMAQKFLAAFGCETILYDPRAGIDAHLDERTALVWVESPGSATFEVQDVAAIAAEAHRAGALVAADNTWATPYLFKPLAHGCDIAMQALSKYASGHGDVLMGSLAVSDEALFRRLKDTARFLGYGVSGDDCALTLRGLATLPVRMRQSAASAAGLMNWLSTHPSVARVLHPSRPDHPGHTFWKRDFTGSAGVFAIVLKPADRARVVEAFKRLRVFRIGASWGGVTSLVAPSDPRAERMTLGWLPAGQLVRFSIGLEDIDDLKDDLEQFLAVLSANRPATRAAE